MLGFTLVEVVIIIAILAILLAIAFPVLLSQVGRARHSEAQVVIAKVIRFQKAYFYEHSKFALSWQELELLQPNSADYRYSLFFLNSTDEAVGIIARPQSSDNLALIGGVGIGRVKREISFVDAICEAKRPGLRPAMTDIELEDDLVLKRKRIKCSGRFKKL